MTKRPWGTFEVLSTNPTVKRITVLPNQRLSLQYHGLRDEFWYFIEGEGGIILKDKDIHVKPRANFYIPRGTTHRIYNDGDTNLVLIEISTGIFKEEDITRIQDDYIR